MKFKVKEKVRVKTFIHKPGHWNSNGKMDKWMGEVVTIKQAAKGTMFPYIIEENDRWQWTASDFEKRKIKYLDDRLFEI